MLKKCAMVDEEARDSEHNIIKLLIATHQGAAWKQEIGIMLPRLATASTGCLAI